MRLVVLGRRPRPPRHYAEAYPRLDVREARKHLMAGRSEVIWRDQRGGVVGKGDAILGKESLTLHTEFRAIAGMNASVEQDEFLLVNRNSRNGLNDHMAMCNDCRQLRRVIIFKDSNWACNKCQGLGQRSSMIGQNARRTERLVALEAEIGDGRPRGMHESTYQRLRTERADLAMLLADARLSASSTYARIITASWQEEGPELMIGDVPFLDGGLPSG